MIRRYVVGHSTYRALYALTRECGLRTYVGKCDAPVLAWHIPYSLALPYRKIGAVPCRRHIVGANARQAQSPCIDAMYLPVRRRHRFATSASARTQV